LKIVTPFQHQQADRLARDERRWGRKREKLLLHLRRELSNAESNAKMWHQEVDFRRGRFVEAEIAHAETMMDIYQRAVAAKNNPRWRFTIEPGPIADGPMKIRFRDEDEMLYLLTK
jgi:hypothetical protein